MLVFKCLIYCTFSYTDGKKLWKSILLQCLSYSVQKYTITIKNSTSNENPYNSHTIDFRYFVLQYYENYSFTTIRHLFYTNNQAKNEQYFKGPIEFVIYINLLLEMFSNSK